MSTKNAKVGLIKENIYRKAWFFMSEFAGGSGICPFNQV